MDLIPQGLAFASLGCRILGLSARNCFSSKMKPAARAPGGETATRATGVIAPRVEREITATYRAIFVCWPSLEARPTDEIVSATCEGEINFEIAMVPLRNLIAIQTEIGA